MICNECAKRKCRAEPVRNKTGLGPIFTCRSFQKPNASFSFLEMAIEGSPEPTLRLLHRFKLRVIETKKGLQVRYDKNNKSR